MDNKLSLHIVWPFVILWIIVAAMVGGDLIPLHLTESAGGIGKVACLVEELIPVDDVDSEPIADDVILNNEPVDQTVAEPLQDDTVLADAPVGNLDDVTYILNTNSMKFHNIGCHSVELIAKENFQASFDTRDVVISNGYVPCENCNP